MPGNSFGDEIGDYVDMMINKVCFFCETRTVLTFLKILQYDKLKRDNRRTIHCNEWK